MAGLSIAAAFTQQHPIHFVIVSRRQLCMTEYKYEKELCPLLSVWNHKASKIVYFYVTKQYLEKCLSVSIYITLLNIRESHIFVWDLFKKGFQGLANWSPCVVSRHNVVIYQGLFSKIARNNFNTANVRNTISVYILCRFVFLIKHSHTPQPKISALPANKHLFSIPFCIPRIHS